MSLPVFLADGQTVVRNGLKPCHEKSLVAPVFYRCGWRRLKTCATNGGGRGGLPHHLFHALRVGQRPMNDWNEKISEKKGITMTPHILNGEDHKGVRQSLRDWLELSFPRYQLIEAASGEEGVTLSQAMAPCLVIMDIGLPGMNGIEAAQGIKAVAPATQVVMLTMFDDEAHRAAAAAAGVSAYVPKRMVQTELLPVLTRLLAGEGGEN